MKYKYLCVVAALPFLGLSFKAWAAADVLYGSVAPTFHQNVQTLNSKMVSEFASTQANLLNAIQENTRQLQSALSVSIAQSSAGTTQVIDARKRAGQALATAYQAIEMQDKVIDTVLNYGSTGQGYNTCKVLVSNATLSKGKEVSRQTAAKMVNETSTGTGRVVHDLNQVQKETVQKHRELFCTQAEASLGLCTVSKLAGGDTNAALLFQPAKPNSLEAEARRTLRGNILGSPDVALNAVNGMTPRGQQYLFALNRKTALQAFPAYSLAAIDAANLQTIKNEAGELRSPNQMIDETIGRYYGTDEAKKFQATMMNQSARGLLVELARQRGAAIWLLNEDYERGLRLEGNLASLLLISAEESNSKMRDSYRTMAGRS
ncbi:TPA: hypothetical protein ACJKZ5_003402 [Acinetobacter baumannii]